MYLCSGHNLLHEFEPNLTCNSDITYRRCIRTASLYSIWVILLCCSLFTSRSGFSVETAAAAAKACRSVRSSALPQDTEQRDIAHHTRRYDSIRARNGEDAEIPESVQDRVSVCNPSALNVYVLHQGLVYKGRITAKDAVQHIVHGSIPFLQFACLYIGRLCVRPAADADVFVDL